MKRLGDNPAAMITGAGSGFGRAMALTLAKRGARLVLSDVEEEGLSETLELVQQAGAAANTQVHTIACDVRQSDQVEAQVLLTEKEFGSIDLLVNNAGIAVVGEIGEVPLSDWQLQMEINLFGVLYGCHFVVPRMKAQGSGYILNVASAAGLLAAPQMGPYNVSKAGVVALSETLYGELAGTDVHVSVLCPTFFQSGIHERARASERMIERTKKLVTNSKWTAEKIAEVSLKGMEKEQLYIVPQVDGRVMWSAKRLLGPNFHRLLGVATELPTKAEQLMKRFRP